LFLKACTELGVEIPIAQHGYNQIYVDFLALHFPKEKVSQIGNKLGSQYPSLEIRAGTSVKIY